MTTPALKENTLLARLSEVGGPHDPERARDGVEDLQRLCREDVGAQGALEAVLSADKGRALVECLFGNSPYLTRLIRRHWRFFLGSFFKDPDALMAELMQAVEQDLQEEDDMKAAMERLRQAKGQASLLIAMADVGRCWSLMQTTGAVSQLAEVTLQNAVRFLLRKYARSGDAEIGNLERPEEGSGIIINAMGKFGAGELNYSSDIDIVIFFEEEKVPASGRMTPQKLCIRLAKDLVRMMQEPTGEGYVFRTDLRLRPDAGATAVALSTDAASFYYETMGQNWERAAMIKARPVAGDLEAGSAFLKQMQPFIWRRYMDFAAIEDVHSIKRQIHAHKGHGEIAVEGHNVKLGRGGIREIEFFAQTQQLIGGGKDPSLRAQTTYGALDALVAARIVLPEVRDDLVAAYEFLRMVEHRIQMVGDEQTHNLPRTAEGVGHIAGFCGYKDTQAFRDVLVRHLETVQTHYAELFEEAPSLGSVHGNLVFTGVEDDPGTLETLSEMGFDQPSNVTEMIRGWHHGRLRVTRSERSRAILTKLIPALLEAMSRTANPGAALANFHRFLEGLPAGVQLFSMLHSNPQLLVLLSEILGTAPRLATTLAKNSRVLESLLDPDFFAALDSKEILKADLSAVLSRSNYFEERLDGARIWSRDTRFRVGVNLLHGDCTPEDSAASLSNIADVTLELLQAEIAEELAPRFGRIEGDIATIAMGKLGGGELSATSDLDLIFVYDTKDAEVQSDGKKPLHNTQYFARFAQRFISAIQSPTAEGVLYEVDARLRPSGRSGPLAVRFEGFENYQLKDAWTWEKMALTRARVVTGSDDLKARIEDVIFRTLTTPRDAEETLKDAREMRRRMAQELGDKGLWDFKHAKGGLVDVEFITQVLQLTSAPQDPSVLSSNTLGALSRLGKAGVLGEEEAVALTRAARLYHRLTQVTRFCVEGTFDPAKASESLRDLMARTAEVALFEKLPEQLEKARDEVSQIFSERLKS